MVIILQCIIGSIAVHNIVKEAGFSIIIGRYYLKHVMIS